MKFAKSAIVYVVATALLLSCMCIQSFAVGTPTGSEAMTVSVGLSNTQVQPGDVITVTLNVMNNYYATALAFPVLFSSSFFELVDGSVTPSINNSTVNTIAGSLDTNTSVADFIPTGYSASEYSGILIQWVAGVSQGTMGVYKQEAGAACFSFSLRVLADATGSSSVFVPAEYDDFYNMAVNSPTDAGTVYYIDNFSSALTLTPANAQVASADPYIEAATGYNVMVDDVNNYIYGFSVDGSTFNFSSQFVAVNGSFSVSMPSGSFGTGTLVMLKNSGGTVVKTYEVVIFGDLSGDGLIDPNDIMLLTSHVNDSTLDVTSPAYLSADLSVDDILDPSDIMILTAVVNGDVAYSAISQTHQPQ